MTLLRVAIIVSLLVIVTIAYAAPTLIDFEGVPIGRAAEYLYAAQGVKFGTNVAIGTNQNNQTAPKPHSGTQLAQLFEGEFGSTPLSFDFFNAQRHITFYGCTYSPRATGVAKAF